MFACFLAASLVVATATAAVVDHPPLPYPEDALSPALSAETLRLHNGKHQATYVAKVNAHLKEAAAPPPAAVSVVTGLVRTLPPGSAAHNMAAQVFNHALYFASMAPGGAALDDLPEGSPFLAAVAAEFGTTAALAAALRREAVGHFGSGWVWLLHNKTAGRLAVVPSHDAACPIAADDSVVPLLVCDVWEHAYYVDRRNDRPAYVDAWLAVVDWAAAARRYDTGTVEAPVLGDEPRGYPRFV